MRVVMSTLLSVTAIVFTATSVGAGGTGTPTPPVQTQTPSSVSPSPSPAASVTPLPPTVPPPTATPELPEEGGPPGGVLGGFLFEDTDGSGNRSAGDSPVVSTINVDRLDESGVRVEVYHALADVTGFWTVRALPDGQYRVVWDPPLRDPSDLSRTLPPAQSIVLNPNETIVRVVRTATISGASRNLSLDLGIPFQEPVPAAPPIVAPNTGDGGNAGTSWTLGALAAAIALSIGGAILLGRRAALRR